MTLNLSDAVYSKTDGLYFPNRMVKSIYAIGNKKGCHYGLSAGFLAAASSVISAGLSYFCVEGAVRSLMITAENIAPLARIRPLGDVGGWLTLPIFAFLGLKAIISPLAREGECIRVKAICKKWILENDREDIENLVPSISYEEIYDLLRDFNKRCFFPKSLASLHLRTLSLCPKSDKKTDKFFLNTSIKPNLKNVEQKIENSSYFVKIYEGQKTISEKGRLCNTVALTFSIALPIILIANALFSITGEVGLGVALYVNRTDLEDTGHFGEWPINAIEALSIAYFLHVWYLLNEGIFTITKNAYTEELKTLQPNPALHNALCKIGNQEMEAISDVCGQMKYSANYKFKKI